MTSKKLLTDIEKATLFLEEARTFFEMSDYIRAESRTQKALRLLTPYHDRGDIGNERDTTSPKYKTISCLAHAYNRLNTIALMRSDFAYALEYAEISIRYARQVGNMSRVAGLLGNIGSIHLTLSDYPRALEYYQQSLTILGEMGRKDDIEVVFHNLGALYLDMADFSRALEYYYKALAISRDLGDTAGIANNLSDLGAVYFRLGDFSHAAKCNRESLDVCRQLGIKEAIARNLNHLGNCHLLLEQPELAMECYTEALAINTEIEIPIAIAETLQFIGLVYTNSSYKNYSPAAAEQYLFRALALFKESGGKRHLLYIHEKLAGFYKSLQQWEKAYSHLEEAKQLEKEIAGEEVQKQVDRFAWERKVSESEKEREIEHIKHEAEKEHLLGQMEAQAQEVQNTVEALVKKNTLLQQIEGDIQKAIPYTQKDGYIYMQQLANRIKRNIMPFDSAQKAENQLIQEQGGFIKRLQQLFPHLSTMELKVAALLRMKLTSSGIATTLFLSRRTVEVHRRNLRKKMGLSTQDDIYLALSTYSTP